MDGSEDAKRAAQKAIDINKLSSAETIAFHSIEHHLIPQQIPLSVPINNTYSYAIPEPNYQEIRDAYISRGKKILAETKDRFEKDGIPIETRLILDKNPFEYIKEIVQEENFDLVILGCKGTHSKMEEIFLGSVAQKVVNRIPVDVLVIR
ncbi:MAG: hypothetical protein GF317_05265 [Candidatus Lokiarchaeota archaeon]|nr:hypothetical protein [Candidatus Lokiarchaeota archaeon]MBD3199216.1 hypothetical protein [Candidatus Lokiarchaeota archaeon]